MNLYIYVEINNYINNNNKCATYILNKIKDFDYSAFRKYYFFVMQL